MKFKVREIQISWRKGKSSRRKIIGVLKRTATNGITFRYIQKGVEEVQKDGFKEYPGFPLDFNKIYHEDDLDIFSIRLIPFDRKDNVNLLKFWEAEGITDKFDLLALTQGILPTDNFEFLGIFNPSKNFRFVTDIAGLSYTQLERGSVSVGDKLDYEIEFSENAFLKKAIKVWKCNTHIGYIKNVHNYIFIKSTQKLKLTVKEVEQNGVIKNVFVMVDCCF